MSKAGHDQPVLGPPELVEVADRVFAYIQPDGTWFINNTGFIVGDEAVVSVDSCPTRRRTRAYLERVASVTASPVRAALADMVAYNGERPLPCHA